MAVATRNELTIEGLAAASGMSVRNIRAHQARGLLEPPELRQRVGYYGPEHLAQLRLIQELQAEGFNLGGIKRLLDETEGTAERLLAFKDALRAVGAGEGSETIGVAELGRRFRVSAQEAPEVLAQAERLGVLVPAADGLYAVPSPSLLALAQEAVERGVSLRSALELLEEVQRRCDAIADRFVDVFLEEVWSPFAQARMPSERWPEVEDAVRRLGPVASQAMQAIFERRLRARSERAFAEIVRRTER